MLCFFIQHLYTVIHNKLCFVVFLCRIHSCCWHHGAVPSAPMGGDCWMDWTLHLTSFLHFKHPIYFFHEMDLVDWIIFTVGRLTVGLKRNELPNQFQMGTTSELSPASLELVLSLKIKWSVLFGVFAFFYRRLQPWSFARYDFNRSRLISAPFLFVSNFMNVSLWKVTVISSRWFIIFKWGGFSTFPLSLGVKQPWNCKNNSV